MKTKQPGMCGAPSAYRRWNSLGVSPTSSRNRLLNDPRLEKPDDVADLGHGQVGGAQQVLGALDPALRDVRRRRDAVRRPEQPLEVELAEPGDAGEGLEVERLGVVAVGVVAGPAQVDEHVTGRPQAVRSDPIWPTGGMSAKIVRLLRRVAGVRHTLTTESRLHEVIGGPACGRTEPGDPIGPTNPSGVTN